MVAQLLFVLTYKQLQAVVDCAKILREVTAAIATVTTYGGTENGSVAACDFGLVEKIPNKIAGATAQ